MALRNLIARLLAKDPGERPQDARAVLERLQRAALPRSPVQEAIAKELGVHAAERSQEASRRAAAEQVKEARRQQIAHARADLEDILADALDDLQLVEPEAMLQSSRPPGRGSFVAGTSTMMLSTGDARFRIEIWEEGAYGAVAGDTMVLAGAVMITNRRYDTELNAANLVYEQAGGRLGWQVYRFRASAMGAPGRYDFGPYGRTHGFRYKDFFGDWGRPFMVHTATHLWQKEVVQLTAETVLDLFQEAAELRPPDPRTGIWSRA